MAQKRRKKAEDTGEQEVVQAPDDEEPPPESERAFGVVGIGASAGGLESAARLLATIPPRSGLAFVLVQHLDPNHESLLVELLSRATSMPVVAAAHNVPLEPDHVYIMPPNALMLVVGGKLTLEPRPSRGVSMPIDLFFRSLALDRRSRAIGIILSGTGTDGSLGIKAVKAEGGITFAESEASAKHHAMPRSAIGMGCIDFVLPAEGIGKELGVLGPRLQVAYSQAELEEGLGGSRDLRKILGMLRSAKGVDFSLYRSTTIRRRIIRRMLLHKLHTVADYLRLLREQPGEIDALYQDVLIRVTGFFRDPAVHEALKESVFPALLRDRGHEQPIRVWVPGCSTGEEAYSIAMGLVECMGESRQNLPVQIFATDVSEES
ncbi:MAG TPA: chemotaxis protein CheB, partial [Candidatus Nanopelagicales bacterium]|nr:chemotaxis protein CheB [Candidatus Nanopelagicales bacterium]